MVTLKFSGFMVYDINEVLRPIAYLAERGMSFPSHDSRREKYLEWTKYVDVFSNRYR